MKKRKIEVAVILAVIALCGFLARRPSKPQSEPPARETRPTATMKLTLPPANLSEEARWLLTTTADSYGPRVPVEKAWGDDSSRRIPSK